MLTMVLLFLSGCDYAHSNMQTLVTDDCGVSWTLIPAGQTVPKSPSPCHYKITVPDYPMQGEVKFKTSFQNRVLATVEVSYDYSIVDAVKFIGEAKYLGSTGNNASNYESAENAVIDKRVREVVTTLLVNEDIVDFSQAEFEDALLQAVNESLAPKGVRLNFLSFVPVPEEQTRLAIDMMTAMKVYESRGLSDLGAQVAVARAGACSVTVQGQQSPPDGTDKE